VASASPELPLDRDDVVSIMGALFDIRAGVDTILSYSPRRTMAKGKKKQILEDWKAGQPERDRVTRMLEERIAYHKAKLEEERAAKEAR
jgi:hypothetical protein